MNRTALITGATDGVGRLVARRLAAQGWRVLIHGRNRQRGREIVGEIEAAGGAARFHAADFAALSEVIRLSRAITTGQDGLHLLINNAGIGYGPRGAGRELSADGFELRLAVNHLAPTLLARLLLPMLVQSAPARIVNVASAAQDAIDLDDPHLERAYSGRDAYRRSKLALIMSTFDLATELSSSGVTVNALHPATSMDTAMVREAGGAVIDTLEDGADAIEHLAVSDTLASCTGRYFDRTKEGQVHPQAHDPVARHKLRDMTALMLRPYLTDAGAHPPA